MNHEQLQKSLNVLLSCAKCIVIVAEMPGQEKGYINILTPGNEMEAAELLARAAVEAGTNLLEAETLVAETKRELRIC